MKNIIDIAIIGGGCAGLMCGCIAGNESSGSLNTVIFERNDKTGRKLLATGNGRCNLSNVNVSADSYFCVDDCRLDEISDYLSFDFTKKLFYRMGLLIKTDGCGRAYPQSGKASSVLDVMRRHIKKYGIEEKTSESILSIKKSGDIFIIKSDKDDYKAKTVILTCGGCASPVFGSDGGGYRLAKALGHTIKKPFPSLAPLNVKENIKSLKGVRCDCEIKLKNSDKIIASECGELQINEDNISGICVFNLSHYVNHAYACGQAAPKIVIDFLPSLSQKELNTFIMKNAFSAPDSPIEEIMTGVINKKLGGYIIKNYTKKSPSNICRNLGKDELAAICASVKEFELTPRCESDLKKAQVSGGGVNLSEIDLKTMSSKKTDGLFFSGEIVDIDAPCGGYNLQWAWGSAAIAAKGAVKRCFNDQDK